MIKCHLVLRIAKVPVLAKLFDFKFDLQSSYFQEDISLSCKLLFDCLTCLSLDFQSLTIFNVTCLARTLLFNNRVKLLAPMLKCVLINDLEMSLNKFLLQDLH